MPDPEIAETSSVAGSTQVDQAPIDPALMREELRRILLSRHFQTSRRGREFLQHVVEQKIGGRADLLKERLIGVEIFGRKPDYSTGEDPVVRVQAGDVRRRLERYHTDAEFRSQVSIEIPRGSYAPIFRLQSNAAPRETQARQTVTPLHVPADASIGAQAAAENVRPGGGLLQPDNGRPALEARRHPIDEPTHAPSGMQVHEGTGTRETAQAVAVTQGKRRGFLRWLAPTLACVAALVYFPVSYVHRQPDSATKAFWQPASMASKPVLLCLPRPMVYKPAEKLFDRYAKTHPGELITRESRQDHVLPLDPSETIQWGDMIPVSTSGPGIGGVIAAINMSKLLSEQGIRFETRFGKESSYAEMRESPVLMVGGINTEWATQLAGETSFAFDETRGSPNIHETGGGRRVWKLQTSEGHVTRDYGLITRQLSGKAGPFFVQVAGISHFGTGAASELLIQPQALAKLLKAYSVSLKKKNLQILVATDVTDERAGPPQVVAVSSW